MNFRRDELTRTARAPAKLNLLLDVLRKRDDGFHAVETLMVALRLGDILSFTPTSSEEKRERPPVQLEVRFAGPLALSPSAGAESIPAGPENLVVQALELLRVRSGTDQGGQVSLVKRIPAAAGLGGASSDAATALRLANRAWGLHYTTSRLAELAAEIGSDVPFFLERRAAICRGRGEIVDRLPPLKSLDVVIVKPPVALHTADVYREYDALPSHDRPPGEIASALAGGSVRMIASNLRNGLERAASALSPWIERLKRAFQALDFLGHQLTGSGSAYFGICRHAQHARRLANVLRFQQLGLVYATRSYP